MTPYLKSGNGLDAFLLKGVESRREGLLLGEESLHGGEVPTIVLGANLRLLVSDPAVNHVCLPHELEGEDGDIIVFLIVSCLHMMRYHVQMDHALIFWIW